MEVNKLEWETVWKTNYNLYLSIDYLKGLELAMHKEMQFYYSISYNENKEPFLISVFQVVKFTSNNNPTLISANILVCGNVFCSGENGFLAIEGLDQSLVIKELRKITQLIKEQNEENKFSIVLLKDFYPHSIYKESDFTSVKYSSFLADVNMVLPIHKDWKTFEDYLFSMKTKYRTRIHSIFSKSNLLNLKKLTKEEIIEHKYTISKLLLNVAQKANYSYGVINVKAFVNFKQLLNENFILTALFLEEKLVGFSTAFINGNVMDANYVGLDYNHNLELNIYQRLLCNYVELAIENKIEMLQFGRTSELIKSALGAKPINMKLYAKHNNSFSNFLLKPMFHFITPSEYELRKPFKANFKY